MENFQVFDGLSDVGSDLLDGIVGQSHFEQSIHGLGVSVVIDDRWTNVGQEASGRTSTQPFRTGLQLNHDHFENFGRFHVEQLDDGLERDYFVIPHGAVISDDDEFANCPLRVFNADFADANAGVQ